MRVFQCRPEAAPGFRRAPIGGIPLLGAFLLAPFLSAVSSAVFPQSASAQWPGDLRGQVVDLDSGAGIPGAVVEVPQSARSTRTDGAGEFRFRSLDPGRYTVTADAPGYVRSSRDVEVRNAAFSHVVLELAPIAYEIEGIRVEATQAPEVGVQRIGRREIETSGARTADALLRNVAGVTVHEQGPGGPATASIRGSGDGAVLVLVDGIPLNDPVSGEADLSTLSTSVVEEITVLAGARSARYGPRAMGGVVLVETRGPEAGLSGRMSGGSLGFLGSRGTAGLRLRGFEIGGALEWMERKGSFPFAHPPEVGGGRAVRENADVRQRSARLTLAGPLAGGELRARLLGERLDRGLPGKSFAPSDFARQNVSRGRAGATWTRRTDRTSFRVVLSGALQNVQHRDPAPPFGLPYDDRTRLVHGGLRLETDHAVAWGSREIRLFAGGDADHQQVRASALDEAAPAGRTDLGLWGGTAVRWTDLPGAPELSSTLRIHRDGLLEEGVTSHDITLSVFPRPLSLHLAHRSAYSPPTLGDQFFREGVAAAPNPELRAERIPDEWELGVSAEGSVNVMDLSGRIAVFHGDVEGMIVWSPDYRFIWSPRNVDVNRRGAEARGEVRHRPSGLTLSGSYTLARATYDRPDPEPVQVIYRPRHTGSVRLAWEPRSGWSGVLGARYLGTRYPVPAPVNALPPFWSFDLHLRGRFSAGEWQLEPALHVDRLLDGRQSFISAFPEPGRTWSVEIGIRSPTRLPGPLRSEPDSADPAADLRLDPPQQ